jgi:hypothetical protein
VREPLRVALRLLGLLLLLLSLGCAVALIWPGPGRVADLMGVTCGDGGLGPSSQCGWLDAASLLWAGFAGGLLAGFVLRMLTRPDGKQPFVIDLSRWRG